MGINFEYLRSTTCRISFSKCNISALGTQNKETISLVHDDVIIKFKPEARVKCFASGEKSLETTIESIHFKFQDAATDNDLENPKILKIGVFPKKRFLGQNMELFALLVDCEELAVPHAESRSIASKYQRIRTQNPD